MQSSQDKLRKFVSLLITWALLLGFFLAYDTYFVAGQKEFIVEREFRTLAGLSRKIADEFDRARLSTESGVKLAVSPETANLKCGVVDCRKEYFALYLGDVLVREESPVDIPECWGRAGLIDRNIPLATSLDKGSLKLDVSCFVKPDPKEPDKPDWASKKPVFVLNMSPWIRTALEQGTDSFEDVLIADSSSHVLFEQGSSGIEIGDLTSIVASGSEFGIRKAGWVSFGQGNQDSVSTGTATVTNPPQKPVDLTAKSAANRVLVAGKNYLMFSNPTRVTLANDSPTGTPITLVLCGLRQEAGLNAESRSLPYGFLIWAGLACIVLLSVSWPLFKLRYMGNTERFSPSDGWYLVLALFLMSSAAALMLLNRSYISQARVEADRRLERLARQMKANFRVEIKTAFEQLRALRNDRMFAQVRQGVTSLYGSYLIESAKPQTYPYFQIAFWANCDGRQILKFDVRPVPTPPTDISRFEFFKAAKGQILRASPRIPTQDRCPEVSQELDPPENSEYVYLQPLMSPNTDEFAPTIAAPFAGLDNSQRVWVQALALRPMSIVEPVLPPGYRFAVIDSRCEVLFHSDAFRNLRENFCDESKDKTELRPWLVAGADAPLNITYGGRTVRAYITTFPVPRLSTTGSSFLLVFEERDRELSLNLAVVQVTSILLAGFFAILAATAAFYLLSRRSLSLIYLPCFMWPQAKSTVAYIQLFVVNVLTLAFYLIASGHLYEAPLLALTIEVALFSIVFGIARLVCSPRSLFRWGVGTVLISGLAMVFMALAHLVFRQWGWADPYSVWAILFVLPIMLGGSAVIGSGKTSPIFRLPENSKTRSALSEHFTAAYALAATSLIACVSLVPCMGFFKYAYDAVSEISLKEDQAVLAERVLARGDRIRSYYDGLAVPRLAACRLHQSLDRYDKLFFSVNFEAISAGTQSENCQILRSDFVSQEVVALLCEHDCTAQTAQREHSNGLNDWIEKAIAKVSLTFPSNEIGMEMSRLGVASTQSKDAWQRFWNEESPRCFALSGTADSKLASLRIESCYPRWDGLTGLSYGSLSLFMIGLVCWLISLTRQIFLTEVESPPAFEVVHWKAIADIKKNYLLIGRTQSGKTRLLRGLSGLNLRNWRDLRAEIAKMIEDQKYQTLPCQGSVMILDHFEFNICDPSWNLRRLELLENLLYQERWTEGEPAPQPMPVLVVVSTIDPSYFFSEETSKILSDGKDAGEASRLFDRWVRVLSKFTKVSLAHSGRNDFFTEVAEAADRGPEHAQSAVWVCKECGSTSQLRTLGMTILQESANNPPRTQAQLTELVLDRAGTYYRVLWSGLTASERLVLYQLALDGWANPKNASAIQQLERKQLICKTPMYRIMNDSFCAFVQSGEHAREISDWARNEQESTWHALRFILIAILIGGGVWLLYTQAQLFQIGTGTMTAIATLLTAVAAFSARFRRGTQQTEANSISS